MFLKITTPNDILFKGEIEKISLPSENGIITILENHMPLVSTIVPGIVTIRSNNIPKNNKSFAFLEEGKGLALSISKGFIFVDGNNINIVISDKENKIYTTEKDLKEAKKKVKNKIEKMREQGIIEEVEKKLTELKKIEADLQLFNMINKK